MSDSVAEYVTLNRDDDWNPDGGREAYDEDTYNLMYVYMIDRLDGARS